MHKRKGITDLAGIQRAQQRLVIVTGKGGVGKSTVALSTAIRLAKQGRKVLLVELGQRDYLARVLGLSGLFHQPQASHFRGLDVCCWTGESCLKEYVLLKVRFEAVYQAFFENRFMQTFLDIAPGLWEVSILGKLTSGIRQIAAPLPYDDIVVDGYASGQTINLLKVPNSLAKTVPSGAMHDQCADIHSILSNSKQTKFIVVSLPELSPMQETLELVDGIKNITDQTAHVVVNRLLKPPADLATIPQIVEGWPLDRKALADYLVSLLKRQANAYRWLEEKTSEKPFILPFLFCNDSLKLAESLSDSCEWIESI